VNKKYKNVVIPNRLKKYENVIYIGTFLPPIIGYRVLPSLRYKHIVISFAPSLVNTL
jgi:hypothetical protein